MTGPAWQTELNCSLEGRQDNYSFPGCPILYPGEPRDESDKRKGSNALSWPTIMFHAFCVKQVIPLSLPLQISLYLPCMLVVIADISHHQRME